MINRFLASFLIHEKYLHSLTCYLITPVQNSVHNNFLATRLTLNLKREKKKTNRKWKIDRENEESRAEAAGI